MTPRFLKLVAAWLALLALMLASLGSAYLPLGAFNLVAGLVIAAIKTGIVMALFMGFRRTGTAVRVALGTALAAWLLLVGLSALDSLTRVVEPAQMQQPRQVPGAFNGVPR